MRGGVLVLIGLLSGLFVSGQAKFSTTVNSREIGKDDYLQVEFAVENASTVDQFTPPAFNGFQVMQEPSQSSETNVINGHVSQKQALTYTLKPLKTGKFVIEGASALVDGKKMQSNPVTIKVTTASTANKGNNGNNNAAGNNPFNPFPQLSWPGFPGTEPQAVDQEYIIRPGENVQEKIRKNLFVKVQVDKTSCYAGEPIVATYKLYSRVRSESRVTKHPSLNGFSVYDMVDPGTDASSVEKVNGKSYIVHIIRKAQLIPLQAGTIDLDPVEVENTVHFVELGKRGSRGGGDGATDPFGQLFGENATGREVEKNATVATQPLTITVKPLPDENKPVDYTGAVGKFSISSALVNRNISAEDEADLKVTVSGSGNLMVISAPQVHWPSGMEAFDPTAKAEVNKTVAPLSGTKTFDYLFTTRDPGHYTIPPVSLSYFDPAARVYKKIQSDPLNFEVMPAAKKKGLPAGIVAAGADQDEGLKALIDRHLESIFAVLILSCLAFYLWRQNRRLRRAELQKETASRERAIRPQQVAMTDPFADVRLLLENGDYKGFYRELNRTVWKAVSDKLALPASELNKYNVVRELGAKGWDTTTILSLEHLLNECEMNLYTPDHDTYNMQQLLRQAESLLGVLISDTSY